MGGPREIPALLNYSLGWLGLWILSIVSRKISPMMHVILQSCQDLYLQYSFALQIWMQCNGAYLLERSLPPTWYFAIVTWVYINCLFDLSLVYDIPHWVCHGNKTVFAEPVDKYPNVRRKTEYSSCMTLSSGMILPNFLYVLFAFVSTIDLHITNCFLHGD